MDRLLLDSDVLIDYLRGQADAVAYLEARTEALLISVISVAELFAGVRDGRERTALETFSTRANHLCSRSIWASAARARKPDRLRCWARACSSIRRTRLSGREIFRRTGLLDNRDTSTSTSIQTPSV